MSARDKPKRTSTSRRVAVNTALNWLALAVTIATNMFLMSYVFRTIGKEAFGVYRLAVSLSMGASYLSFGMASGVMRLASESIAARDWHRLGQRMSVARAYLLGAAAVAGAALVLASFFLLGPLKVPLETQPSARILLQLAGLSAVVHLLYTLYVGLLHAMQRFDLAAGVQIFEILFRAGLIVVLYATGWVGLVALGASMAVSSLLGLGLLVVFVRRSLPDLNMSFRKLARQPAREVMGFSGWVAISDGARQALDQGSIPAVSATLGIAQAAVFSVPKMLCQYMLQPAVRMLHAMRPAATTYAVRGQRDNLERLCTGGSRLAMASMALPTALFVSFGSPFLRHWMGPGMESAYAPLLVLLALTYLRGAGEVAEQWILSVGRIRGLAVSRMVAAAVGLASGVAIGLWTEWGLAAMIGGFYVPTALRAVFYLPWLVRRDVGVPVRTSILGCSLAPLLAALVPAAVGLGISAIWSARSFLEVLLQMALVSCTYPPVVWWLMFTSAERRVVAGVIRPRRTTPS